MNRKQQELREQDEIRILGRKLIQRLAPEEQKPSEIADGLGESFNSRKLKAWHMMQEAGAANDLRTLKMIDKLTAQYDMASCSGDIADFMERNQRNDILKEEFVHDMTLTLEELKSVLASSERVKAALMKQAGW